MLDPDRPGGAQIGGSEAAPLAATQDTSGEDRQDPCPVLQPAAPPAGHLYLRPTDGWTAVERKTTEKGDIQKRNPVKVMCAIPFRVHDGESRWEKTRGREVTERWDEMGSGEGNE